jgi:predicted nucleotidyltransferase
MTDPNLAPLVKIARALGPLRDEAVFVGGSVVGLLLTDPAAQRIRPTDDIDLIVEIATRPAFARLEERLRNAGFRNDPDGPICRWLYHGTKVDVMPDDSKILGFSNPWYREALASALTRDLAKDLSIRLISAPCFLATKLTAFLDRGKGDFLASPDLEDLIAVIDGRDSLMAEIAGASA